MIFLRILLCFIMSQICFCLHSNFLGNTKGAKLFRVVMETDKHLTFLKEQYKSDVCDFWSMPKMFGVPVDMMVVEWLIPVFENMLKKREIPYEIYIDDVQSFIDKSRLENEKAVLESNGKMNWQAYHNYETISTWLDEIAHTFPFVTVKEIGKTFEKRPIKLVKISSTSSATSTKPALWIDGGMQGREWISPAVVTYLINELTGNHETYSALLEAVDVYAVAVANPDGYAYSMNKQRLWKKNRRNDRLQSGCVGIDLGRNWEFHWNEVENSTNVCSGSYPGKSAFSECETRSLSTEMMNLSPRLKTYLSMGSFGQYWNSPWSFTSDLTYDFAELNEFSEGVTRGIFQINGTQYKYGSVIDRSIRMSGASHDWAKGVIGVKYSFQIDLPDEGDVGFFLSPQRIEDVGKDMTQALKFALNHVKNKFPIKERSEL